MTKAIESPYPIPCSGSNSTQIQRLRSTTIANLPCSPPSRDLFPLAMRRSLPPPPPPPTFPAKGVMVSSSPGPAEKLTAPGFTRLLRGKGGSRSRGRTSLSRSSPLFASRSRSLGRSATTPSINAAEEGEPSSPTVTCIGQVRIRKKKQNKSGSDGSDRKQNQQIRCCSLDRSLLCNIFPRRRRASGGGKPRRSIWPDWALGFRFEGNAKHRQRKEPIHPAGTALTPPRVLGEMGRGIVAESDDAEENKSADSEEEVMGFLPSKPSTPPKNALILMRCRSAPLNRFSASPIPALASDDESDGEDEGREGRRGAVSNTGSESSGGGDKEEEARYPSSRPLFLQRCKSEPARKAARLVSSVSNGGGGGENCWSVLDEGTPPLL